MMFNSKNWLESSFAARRRRSKCQQTLMKLCIFIFILLCWQTKALATITMQIEPSNPQAGETIRLTLTQDDMQSNATPDWTPLEKDFSLSGTAHNMSYTAVNGVAKSESQWVVLLIPKRAGVIAIPPIQIGQQYSQASQVEIGAATTTHPSPSENNAVILKGELSQNKSFINEQVTYTVKLYSRQSLVNAQYQPPHVENALLIPLGNGRRYQTTMNGLEYSVDEQQYAIFSQKSGALQITPPKLSAVTYSNVPRQINLEADPITLTVKPIPETNANQPWLPAKQVTLAEQYDSSTTTATQGATVQRTITIRAVGIPAELLPNLTFADSPQFSIYPEKPDTHNTLRQQELAGTSIIKVTYVLNQPGQITLPSVKLAWFNTKTGTQEVASLPSHDIMVATKPGASHTPPVTLKKPQQNHSQATPAPKKQSRTLAWWVAGAFGFAWIMTLALWGWFRHRGVAMKHSIRPALARLRKACKNNDPTQAHAALLDWGRLQWPDTAIFNLNQLSLLVSHIGLKKQITLLSQALYSQNGVSSWRGDALWNAVEGYRPFKSTPKITRDALPPINPSAA